MLINGFSSLNELYGNSVKNTKNNNQFLQNIHTKTDVEERPQFFDKT
jgi:hypothetical protein